MLLIGRNRFTCEGDLYLNLEVEWLSTSDSRPSRLVMVLSRSFVDLSQVSLRIKVASLWVSTIA